MAKLRWNSARFLFWGLVCLPSLSGCSVLTEHHFTDPGFQGRNPSEVKILADGQSVAKTVRVSSQLARVSPERWRDHFWQRVFSSGESALPDNSAVESILVDYPERNIPLGVAGYEMNWIWLFFILSMIAGFIFKELLGIQV